MDGTSVWLAVRSGSWRMLAACLISSIRIRRSQAVLGEENRLFDAALSNMAQGLNVFEQGRTAGLVQQSLYRNVRSLARNREAGRRAAGPRQSAARRRNILQDRSRTLCRRSEGIGRSLTPTQRERELADGRVINVVNCPLAGGGWVVTHEDVTERWRAEREVESTHNFLQTVIENVPTTIVVKDARTLCYVMINRAAEEFYGVPREQMIGKTAVGRCSRRERRKRSPRATGNCSKPAAGNNTEKIRWRCREANGVLPGRRACRSWAKTERRNTCSRSSRISPNVGGRRPGSNASRTTTLAPDAKPHRFPNVFASVLERATTADESFAVLSVDLDRFKEVNDVFGHAFGDRLLRAVAERLNATVAGRFSQPDRRRRIRHHRE